MADYNVAWRALEGQVCIVVYKLDWHQLTFIKAIRVNSHKGPFNNCVTLGEGGRATIGSVTVSGVERTVGLRIIHSYRWQRV